MKNLLLSEEIRRQKKLMGLIKENQILNEDGLVTWLSKKLRSVFDNVEVIIDPKTKSVIQKKVSGIDVDLLKFDDIKTVASDLDFYGTNMDEYVDIIVSIINKEPEIKLEIYKSLMERALKESLTFQKDSDLLRVIYDAAKTTNPTELRTFLDSVIRSKMRANGYPDDDVHNMLYEIFTDVAITKIAKLNVEGTIKADIDFTKSLINVNNWKNIDTQFSSADYEFLQKELSPTLRQSVRNFFSFFNKTTEVQNLQKYMKMYEEVTDTEYKLMIEKYIEKKYANLFNTKRDIYNEMTKWISDVAKKYGENATPENKKLLEKFEGYVKSNDWTAIAALGKSDGTLAKAIRNIKEIFEGSTERVLGFGGNLKKEVGDEVKKFSDEYEVTVKNKRLFWYNKNWLKSGSKYGWPSNTNKLWMDLTGGNLSAARKKYALNLFGRYIVHSVTFAILEQLLEYVSFMVLSSDADDQDKIDRCLSNIEAKLTGDTNDDKIFQKNWEEGKTVKSELPDPCGKFGVLWGCEYALNSQGKNKMGIPNWLLELGKKATTETFSILNFDSITDIFPGKIDDIVVNFINAITYSSDKKNIDNFVESLESEVEKQRTEMNNEGAKISNNTEGLYKNNLGGFQEYLKKELGSSDGAKGTKDTFTHDGLTYEFTEEPTKKPLGYFGVVVN